MKLWHLFSPPGDAGFLEKSIFLTNNERTNKLQQTCLGLMRAEMQAVLQLQDAAPLFFKQARVRRVVARCV